MSENLHIYAVRRRNPLDKYHVIGYYKKDVETEKVAWHDELPFGYSGLEFRNFVKRELRARPFSRNWIDEAGQILTDMNFFFSENSHSNGYVSLTDLNRRFKKYYKENKVKYKHCLKRAKKEAHLEDCYEYEEELESLEYLKRGVRELSSMIDLFLAINDDFLSESDDVQICYCFS